MNAVEGRVAAGWERHLSILRDLLQAGLHSAAQALPPVGVRMESGLIYPRLVLDPLSQLDDLSLLVREGSQVADAAGHRRQVYPALLAYCWAQSIHIARHAHRDSELVDWTAGLIRLADQFSLPAFPTHVDAAHGTEVAVTLWSALALDRIEALRAKSDAGRLVTISNCFGSIISAQKADGSFLGADPSAGPETTGFDELTILHALSSYAVTAGRKKFVRAVERAAIIHQEQTQPDHVTTQPWALLAFCWNPGTQPLAEQVLHSASIAISGAVNGVSLMLLADALYGLRQLAER